MHCLSLPPCKRSWVGRRYVVALWTYFLPIKTNYVLFKYLSLDCITYYLQDLLCLYKIVAYFKVNTIQHMYIFLFSSVSKFPQGFNCSLYQFFTMPLGTLLKNLLQMLHSEKKNLCSVVVVFLFVCLYFTVAFPSSTWGSYLLFMNAPGSHCAND